MKGSTIVTKKNPQHEANTAQRQRPSRVGVSWLPLPLTVT